MHSAGTPSLLHSQAHTSSSYSIQSQPSSRSSDTTQGTSQSTLFAPPTPAGQGMHVEPSNNVMNKVADKDQSLFQICVILRQRLKGVPGFETFLEEEEQGAEEEIDPVDLLWRTFRRGYPLLELYNVLRPEKPIRVNTAAMSSEVKKGKAMTFKFINACINDLNFKVEDCFIILDLYGDDTTGFVKVTRMVTRLLDILVKRGLIEDTRRDSAATYNGIAASKRSLRQHIVEEIVSTERTYVQQLELLQAFKLQCEKTGVIPGDVIHQIFLNLNALLDFQRRFLIRVEQINASPEEEQNWGRLFFLYSDAFNIYEPYITNQKLCEETVTREFDKLKAAGGSAELQGIVANASTLYSFLMKPFQRLSKYPLFLNELYKKGDLDEDRKADLLLGKECATNVLTRTNDAMDREDKLEAVHELKNRVEDWKGHKVEAFGELLLFGTFTVVNGDAGPGRESEREYHMYFFEPILLCCKDIDPTKAKNKMKGKPLVDRKGKPKLQLKGRIFMQNVTDVLKASKAGSYTCQIFWKGDPGIENFIIRFSTEEVMTKWYTKLLEQRKHWADVARSSDPTRPLGTSSTEFTYIQNQGVLKNPYQQDDDEEEDMDTVVSPNSYGSFPSSSEYARSRNASNSSLRSRSTTVDSGPIPAYEGSGRMGPPRFPPGTIPMPGLSLRTHQLQNGMQSPADRLAESYFSPTTESPVSSYRTSSPSGTYPFPRQPSVPPQHDPGHERYTAPSMPYRSSSREAMNGQTYPQSARMPPRPGFPQGTGMHSAQAPPSSRNRSASSPNIHDAQRRALSSSRPPMPEIPASSYSVAQLPQAYPNAALARSQSNSPHLSNSMELSRPGAQSPRLQRERAGPPSHGLPPPPFGFDAAGGGNRMDARVMPTSAPRTTTPVGYPLPKERMPPPPPPTSTPTIPLPEPPQPTQLKVKVHATAAGQVLTLVVPLNISYQTLKDRIDAKLQRSTNISLSDRGSGNQVKLKYMDDDDLVSIQSDEDVQIAFETWREQRGEGLGGMGEIELFCQ